MHTALHAYRTGTPRQAEAARNQLWEEYLPLIRKVAAQFPHLPAPISKEDVADLATEALFAVFRDPKYDPQRPDAAGYLRRTLRNVVLMEIRKRTARGRYSELSVEEPVADGALVLGDTLADPHAGMDAAEARVMIQRAWPTLLPNQQRALALACEGRDVADVARLVGQNRRRTERTLQAIQRKVARANLSKREPANYYFSQRREKRYPVVLSFTCDEETAKLLTLAARAAKKSRSAWLREAIRKRA